MAMEAVPMRLHILVQVVHPRHVGRPVAHDQVCQPRLVAITELVKQRLPDEKHGVQ